MENKKILSISVAAYNLEKLIEQNLDSFVSSKVNDDIEVIVTDDGSKDSTASIVEKYVEKYPNTIKLVKQKNSGAGSTVNSGIKNATGKYFKMIDGDDWVETENLNTLVKKLKEIDVDMVITNYETYDESKNEIISVNKYDLPSNKIMDFNEMCGNLHFDMHNIAFKTSILKENNITLDNGFYTDVEYLLLPVKYIKNVVYLDLNIYVYRIARAGQSVSLGSMQKNINMHDLVLRRLIKNYEEIKNEIGSGKKEYMAKRLGDMADVQLKTLLTFDITPEQKQKVKEYFNSIKEESIDVYNKFITGKKEKLLLKSNFVLIKQVSNLIKRKF